MADYIDRQATIDKINERQKKLIYCFGFENDAVKIMDIAKSIVIAIPSADVVPVVRCEECLFFTTERSCCRPEGLIKAREDEFCGYGERREEQNA